MKENYSKKRVMFLKKNKEYDALYRYCASFALEHNLDAFLEVSKCYMHGWGVEKNELHAYLIHTQLSSQDYPKGYYYLAWDYYEGKGTKQNLKKAYKYFLISAQKGIVDAMFNVGIFCYNGLGCKKDQKQALYWFNQAASLGHVQAQFNLGVCYDKGIGTNRDSIKSNYWLEQASSNGSDLANRYQGREDLALFNELEEIYQRVKNLRVDQNIDLWLDKMRKQLDRMEEKSHGN